MFHLIFFYIKDAFVTQRNLFLTVEMILTKERATSHEAALL